MTGESDDFNIQAELEDLTRGVADVRDVLRVEGEKRDKRIKTAEDATQASIDAARKSSRTARFATAVAIVAIVAAVIGIRNGILANSDRKQRTVAACGQANVTAQNTATLVNTGDFKIIDQIAEATDADPRAVADAKVIQRKAVQNLVDTPTDKGGLHRDCSPSGLRRYYSATTTTAKK